MHKLNEWIMSHFFELIVLLSVLCLGLVLLGFVMG